MKDFSAPRKPARNTKAKYIMKEYTNSFLLISAEGKAIGSIKCIPAKAAALRLQAISPMQYYQMIMNPMKGTNHA